jgi:hypothetical protein
MDFDLKLLNKSGDTVAAWALHLEDTILTPEESIDMRYKVSRVVLGSEVYDEMEKHYQIVLEEKRNGKA